ncbi:MAG TPA: potassium ABC transporter ATPase [Burkholderiaceae bacterium]|nr:potassium ABC transporter ATPase [Burkholderiaceae bacterium]
MDIIFVGALVAFLVVTVAFAAGCDKLGGLQ